MPIIKVQEKKYAYPSSWNDKDVIKCIVCYEEKRRPLPSTNISLKEKTKKTLKEYSELHIKNNNATYIDGANLILLTLATRSLLAADVAYHESFYQAFRSKGCKKKSQKDETKNFADSHEAAWNEFCQIVKIILSYEENIFNNRLKKSMCSEIRSTKTLSSSVRSIDIKEKMKNALNENIVFKIK